MVIAILVQVSNHDLTRPRDQIVEKLLGTTPTDNRRVYFQASPIEKWGAPGTGAVRT